MSEVNDVTQFLASAGDLILREVSSDFLKGLDGMGVQALVLEYCQRLNAEYNFGFEIRETKKQGFPDLVINKVGVEIKSTVKDHWVTTGNSISESQRDNEVEQILFFFVKLGGQPRFLVRRYEDCLKNVIVTHNPRYSVDMQLPAGKSVFHSMGISYDDFRRMSNPMIEVRRLYRESLNPGETLWWIDNENSGEPQIIKNFNNLGSDEKKSFFTLAMSLCPEIFGTSSSKYERLPGLLLAEFRAVSSNVRDKFSAGGQATLDLGHEGSFEVRAIDSRLYSNARQIADYLQEAPEDTLREYWRLGEIPSNRNLAYSELLNSATQNVVGEILVGDIFLAGL